MQKMFFLVSLFLIGLLCQGCNREPSPYFKGFDINSDGFISYVEWMHFPGDHTHSIYFCYRMHFYEGDCDADDRLSWEEYYQRRFKKNRCSPIMPPRPLLQAKPGTYYYSSVSAVSGIHTSSTNSESVGVHRAYTKEYIARLWAQEKYMMRKYKLTYEMLPGQFVTPKQ